MALADGERAALWFECLRALLPAIRFVDMAEAKAEGADVALFGGLLWGFGGDSAVACHYFVGAGGRSFVDGSATADGPFRLCVWSIRICRIP